MSVRYKAHLPRYALPLCSVSNESVGESGRLGIEGRLASWCYRKSSNLWPAGHDREVTIDADLHLGQFHLGKHGSFALEIIEVLGAGKELATWVNECEVAVKESPNHFRVVALHGLGPPLFHR